MLTTIGRSLKAAMEYVEHVEHVKHEARFDSNFYR